MRKAIVVNLGACLLLASAAAVQVKTSSENAATTADPASGRQTYVQYCASCHGDNLKGAGPAASALKTPPPDLTTLAKRHDGKFRTSNSRE